MAPSYTDPAARPQVSPQASRARVSAQPMRSLRTVLIVLHGCRRPEAPSLDTPPRSDGFKIVLAPGKLQSRMPESERRLGAQAMT